MRRNRVVALLAALATMLGAGASVAFTSPPSPSTAAARYGWGQPSHAEEFNGPGLAARGWSVYNGPGHHGQGRRSPAAFSTSGGILRVHGDANGTTGGMSANWPGSDQRYGRWEVRMKTSTRDPRYHAVLILWPQDGYARGKCDGEVDFSENTHDLTKTHFFLHHGCANNQTTVAIPNDTTTWHTYGVQWTATSMTGYIDGRVWFKDTNVADLPPRPMHATIQLDYFPHDGSGPLKPTDMYVDWLRQYPLRAAPVPAPSPTATPTGSPTATPTGPAPTPTVTVTQTVTATVTVCPTAKPTPDPVQIVHPLYDLW